MTPIRFLSDVWATLQHASPPISWISHSFTQLLFLTLVPRSFRLFIFHKLYCSYSSACLEFSRARVFGIHLQSKFLKAVSSQPPAQESHICLHSPCSQGNIWCTQNGMMQPVYSPGYGKEHVSTSCHLHPPTCWKQEEGHNFLWQPEINSFTF